MPPDVVFALVSDAAVVGDPCSDHTLAVEPRALGGQSQALMGRTHASAGRRNGLRRAASMTRVTWPRGGGLIVFAPRSPRRHQRSIPLCDCRGQSVVLTRMETSRCHLTTLTNVSGDSGQGLGGLARL